MTSDALERLCNDLLLDVSAVGSVCVADRTDDPIVVCFLASPAVVGDAPAAFDAAGWTLTRARVNEDTIEAYVQADDGPHAIHVTTEQRLRDLAASGTADPLYDACTIVASRSRVVAGVFAGRRVEPSHVR